MIKSSDLQKISGSRSRSPMLDRLASAFNRYAFQYGVVHQKDIADFLAHVSVETGGFRSLSESLNYSTDALSKLFGSHRITKSQIAKYGRKKGQKANQIELANILYGGAWGKKNLGNINAGDGWKFRGSGAGQVTGRANFARAQRLTGIDFLGNPDLMRDPNAGVEAALALWREWDMNKYAGGSRASRKKWNGGSHGLDDYQKAYNRAMKLKLSVPEPVAPITVSLPEEHIARLEEIANDAAATDRISTTKIAASVTGVGSAIGAGSQVVEQIHEAQTVLEMLVSASPWLLLGLVCMGSAFYIWRERNRKAKEALI